MTVRPQEWFEMNDVRRRALARAVWIPLRAIRTVKGEDGSEEVFAAGGTAFPPVGRGQAEQLGWDNLGLGHEAKPFAFDDGTYKPVEVYQHDDKVDLAACRSGVDGDARSVCWVLLSADRIWFQPRTGA